jgi:hypothetical protein
MIDLTNKNVDEINGLIQKYIPILELIKEREQIPYIAYVLEYAVNYIKSKYLDLNKDWKTWTILVIKNQYLNDKIQSESDIELIADEFIEYWKQEHQNYVDDLALWRSEVDRDSNFVHMYIDNKNR